MEEKKSREPPVPFSPSSHRHFDAGKKGELRGGRGRRRMKAAILMVRESTLLLLTMRRKES